MKQEPEDAYYDRFAGVIGGAMSNAANESVVLARLEEFFDPKPVTLADGEQQIKELQERVDRLIEKLGGPPRLIITGPDERKHTYDIYPSAALSEVLKVFDRSRRSVTRAQMYLIGSHLLNEHPEFLNLSTDEKFMHLLQKNVSSVFWEHAETSFIRLASYWDRVGQVLDFVFFGIRHFEDDGFSGVMDRIHNNILPLQEEMKNLVAWKELRAFQTSEKENGLKWLLRRRNLVIHSLHLQPMIDTSNERELFDFAYNHLEEKLRNKLKPGTPTEEIRKIHLQLSAAAELFRPVLSLCEHYLDNNK